MKYAVEKIVHTKKVQEVSRDRPFLYVALIDLLERMRWTFFFFFISGPVMQVMHFLSKC